MVYGTSSQNCIVPNMWELLSSVWIDSPFPKLWTPANSTLVQVTHLTVESVCNIYYQGNWNYTIREVLWLGNEAITTLLVLLAGERNCAKGERVTDWNPCLSSCYSQICCSIPPSLSPFLPLSPLCSCLPLFEQATSSKQGPLPPNCCFIESWFWWHHGGFYSHSNGEMFATYLLSPRLINRIVVCVCVCVCVYG